MGLLVLIYFILGLVAYHAIFDIWYFNFKKAIINEIIGAFIFAALMTGITLKFWLISVVVLLIVGGCLSAKCSTKQTKTLVMIVTLICIVLVAVQGRNFNKTLKDNNTDSQSAEEDYEEDDDEDEATIESDEEEEKSESEDEDEDVNESEVEETEFEADVTVSQNDAANNGIISIVYGTYENHNENYICDAEVGFYTSDEDVNYVYLEGVSTGNHGATEETLNLYLQNDGSYLGKGDGTDTVAIISFSEGYMNVDIQYSDNSDSYNLTGTYKLTSELDMSNVG